ncbi:MAG: NAD(P)/FAD-dependent oxidoreductase [Novosphingobium sp.]
MRGNSMVWRALARARRANLGSEALIRGRSGMTRRRVLAGLTAGTTMALAGCNLPQLEADKTRVAIIGGGLAGLNALRLLRGARIDARLYEARGRLGGRVFTARGGPVPADDGGQFINSDHIEMLAASKRYGLGLINRGASEGKTLVIDGGKLITEAELAKDLEPIAAIIAADAKRLDTDYARHAPPLDALSVSEYLDQHAQAVPKPYVRKLLEATIRTEFGQEPQDASTLELLFNLPVADGKHVELIGSSDEKFILANGSGSLVDAMAPGLMPWIETGHAVQRIERTPTGVRLRFANGRSVEAERAIVTVPAPLLRTIDFGGMLSPLWHEYATEIDVGRNEKLNAAYEGRPWRQTMGLAGDVWPLGGPFAESWDATTVQGEVGLMTWFMGGAQCSAVDAPDLAEVRRSFELAAAPALPTLGDSATGWQRRTNWARDPYARGAYSCFKPGQLTRFAELMWIEEDGEAVQIPATGSLIFAGEHLSDAFPGYMEGGLQTGRLAAQTVIAALKVPPPVDTATVD